MQIYDFLVSLLDDIAQDFRVLARVFPALLMISLSISSFSVLLKLLFRKR